MVEIIGIGLKNKEEDCSKERVEFQKETGVEDPDKKYVELIDDEGNVLHRWRCSS